ncbi:MAG: radical SAM protein [Chitinispirillaceae bacterium]|nr:radical SAM protein [Chitinispirillaceae bacterium]
MPASKKSLKRATVIIPPIEDFYITPHRMSSLGISIVLQILEKAHFDVLLIDAMETPLREKPLPLPRDLSYLKPHLLPRETGKCSFFSRFSHFGKSYHEIIEKICIFEPAICFIGCFAWCYSSPVIELAKRIKKCLSYTTVVAGGAGVSVYPDYFLREAAIDHIISGEAEINLPRFLDYFLDDCRSPESVPGLGWKKGQLRRCNPSGQITYDDTILPVVKKNAETPSRIIYSASLSRGCPEQCRFCANHLVHGRSFRRCTMELFDARLKKLPRPKGSKEVHFNFEDDNLLCDTPFFMALLVRGKEAFPSIRFSAENGLDYRLLTPERCGELIDAGFRQFNFTLGSVAREVRERAERTARIDRYDRLLDCAERRGIPVVTYVICGFPDETKDSIAENLRFLLPRATIIGLSLFYPVPGIPGFEDRTIFEKLLPQVCTGASAYPWSRHLTTETLITAFRLARLINLMKTALKSAEETAVIERTISTGRLHTVVKEQGIRRIVEVPKQDAELVGMVVTSPALSCIRPISSNYKHP